MPRASECLSKVSEVVPGRVALHESTRDIETRAVIDGEEQGLLRRGRPPLMDGAVVLPEFADMGAAEPPVNAGLALRGGHEMGVVGLDVGFHRRTCSCEAAEPKEFVGDELVVGWGLEGKELLEESFGLGGPLPAPSAAAGRWLVAFALAQKRGAHPRRAGSGLRPSVRPQWRRRATPR